MQLAAQSAGSERLSSESRAATRWPWEAGFMALLAVSMVATVWLKCHRTYLGHDEIITALLVKNTSLGNLLDGIRHGTETNPPLFFIFQWIVARLFGPGDLAMSAISGLSMALAVPVLFLTLRGVAGARLAALAVAFVFGLSRDVYLFGTWARYYGWMVLLASVVAWLFVRAYSGRELSRRDHAFVFVTHTAMVYTHLFGLFFSGMTLAAHLVMDWLNGKLRWRLYGAIAGAWAVFALWVPALPAQLSVTKDGTYTPRLNVGMFFEELEMQTPLALILLFIAGLGFLAWVSRGRDVQESPAAASSPVAAMLVLAGAWMLIAVGAWAASHVVKPFFMRRYVAPCVVAWVLMVCVTLVAIWRLARGGPRMARLLPAWVPELAAAGVLAFCVVWQPLRAWKEPPKAPTAFVDHDLGYAKLPIVFEDPMDFLPRALYGNGEREYVLVLDKAAAAASSGYYTKLNENYHGRWLAYYPGLRILYYEKLPAWPEGFLAVDDDLALTFDWLFKNKPELRAELVGPWANGKKLWLVRRVPKG